MKVPARVLLMKLAAALSVRGIKLIRRTYNVTPKNDPDEEVARIEQFCEEIDMLMDVDYAMYKGVHHPERYTADKMPGDDEEPCCDRCLKRMEHRRKMYEVSKLASRTRKPPRQMLLAIVTCEPILKYVAEKEKTPSGTDESRVWAVAFLPESGRFVLSFDDPIDRFATMVGRDYADLGDQCCSACGERVDRNIQTRCMKCMAFTCVDCLAQLTLYSGDKCFPCPECGESTETLVETVNDLTWYEAQRWKNIWRALESLMEEREEKVTQLTLIRPNGSCISTRISLASPTGGVLPNGRVSRGKTAGPLRRRVFFVGGQVPDENLMTDQSIVFAVGDLPDITGCDVDRAHIYGVLQLGSVLSTDVNGEVVEGRDLFGPYAVLAARHLELAPNIGDWSERTDRSERTERTDSESSGCKTVPEVVGTLSRSDSFSRVLD